MALEGILINSISEALKKLVTAAAREIGFAWGVKDDLKKLQGTLDMILAVIADADRKQVTDEAVRLWLRKLKGVAYDADDVVDEFTCETMRRRERHNLKYKVCDFLTTSNPLAITFKMAKKIKDINHRLDEITKDMDRFQLEVIRSSSTADAHGDNSERRSRITTSFMSQSQIVGREDDKNKLIKILTTVTASSPASVSNTDNHLENVNVVSIVGMGGLGKTALAQLVYNNDSVKSHFQPKMWVCVSDHFDVYRLLSDIMESITQEKFSNFSNFDVLVHKVREQLSGKRYLLVLDDLWNEDAEQWERLQSSLTVGAQGSKILTTTRKRQVADVVKGSASPYLLEKLHANECWFIMERKAFSPGGALQTPNMTKIGKEIANKCSGLPLAAKFLGSLMHARNKESSWLSIRDNSMWNTPESKIIPILKMSYNNLSPHLQRCFSYCSIFPKDTEVHKQTIIRLWMAEGFLQPASNVGNDYSFERIGDECFESLMWSSFFDGVKKNMLDDVTTFKMHDLVHDLAQTVAGEQECSTVKVTTDQLDENSEVRRLNLILDENFSTSSKIINNLKKLRTFIVLELNYRLNLRGFSSKHLRILHLGDPAKDSWEINVEINVPTSKLRQLRYLHVSTLQLKGFYWAGLISRLYNLQTLVLRGCTFVQNVVEELGSLKHLRHLDISFSDIKELPDSVTRLPNLERLDLNHCENLTTFPDSVTGLAYLRFFDVSFTPIEKVPDFVVSLLNLHTLDVNTCKKLKALPEYVSGLQNLSIFNFKNCPLLEALPRDFGTLYHLRSLDLEGTAIKVLDDESYSNLYNLEYVNLFWCELPKQVRNWTKLRKFLYLHKETPLGIGKLVRLQTLSYSVRDKGINNPEFSDGIEELGNLDFLEILNIHEIQNVKDPIDAKRANLIGKQNLRELALFWNESLRWDEKSCDFQVFEALQPPTGLTDLRIRNFMGWNFPTWMCVPSSFPGLQCLKFKNCKGIIQLPPVIGQLQSLRYLTLKGMCLKNLDIGGFPSLMRLDLIDMFLLEEFCHPYPCLQFLKISGCKSLSRIPWFPSLKELELQKVDLKLITSTVRSHSSLTKLLLQNLEEVIFFPLSILQNSCNLQILQIKNCSQLQGFGVIDDVNQNDSSRFHIASLRELLLVECPVLKFLADLRGLTSLQELGIFGCPQVQESLTYDLKSISSLKCLWVDFIQRDEQRGDPSCQNDLINLLE